MRYIAINIIYYNLNISTVTMYRYFIRIAFNKIYILQYYNTLFSYSVIILV